MIIPVHTVILCSCGRSDDINHIWLKYLLIAGPTEFPALSNNRGPVVH